MRHIVRHGKTVPTIDNLDNYQLGVCTTNKKLYIRVDDEVINVNDFSSEPIQPSEKRTLKLTTSGETELYSNQLNTTFIPIAKDKTGAQISMKVVVEHGSQSDYLRLLFTSEIRGLTYDMIYQVHNSASSSGLWTTSSKTIESDGYVHLFGKDGLALNGFVSSMSTMPIPYRVESLLTIQDTWHVSVNLTFTTKGIFLEIINTGVDTSANEIIG